MDLPAISPEAISGQKLALLQQQVGVHALRMAIDTEAAQGEQLVRLMNQNAGIGTTLNTQG